MVFKILLLVLFIALYLIVFEVRPIFLAKHRAQSVIANSAPYTQKGNGLSILVAGDSTGYGTGATHPEDSVAGRIGTMFPDATIENSSVNGLTLREVSDSLSGKEGYDIVVLQAGGNDILQVRRNVAIESDVTKLLSVAKGVGSTVVFLSTGDVGASPAFGPLIGFVLSKKTKEARDILLEASEEVGVKYIDLYDAPKDNVFLQDPDKYHSDDKLHPSSAGYGVWFEKLQPVLQEVTEGNYGDIRNKRSI